LRIVFEKSKQLSEMPGIELGSLSEALHVLVRQARAGRIVVGCQGLVPMMNLRLVKLWVPSQPHSRPRRVQVDGGELVTGVLARHSALLASELVAMH
jgi:CO/xanthine dehydrogenase FAD-binding subunit